MLFATLKDKKKFSRRYKGKPTFQTIAIELYKQLEKHLRLVTSSITVGVVPELLMRFMSLVL